MLATLHASCMLPCRRKDKYQKGLYLYWVDTAITGESETGREERLEDEISAGEKETDHLRLGGLDSDSEIPDDVGSGSDSGDESMASSKKKHNKRKRHSRRRSPSMETSTPSPKKKNRRSHRPDEKDLDEERAVEARIVLYTCMQDHAMCPSLS